MWSKFSNYIDLYNKMNKFLHYFFAFFCCVVPALVDGAEMNYPKTYDNALNELERELKNKEDYVQRHIDRIDSLKSMLDNSLTSLSLYERIGDEFSRINADSAVMYLSQGLALAHSYGDSVYVCRFKSIYSSLLPILGVTKEGVDLFDSIDPGLVSGANKELYYESGNRLFFYLSSYCPIKELRLEYMGRGLQCTDSLLSVLPENTAKYCLYAAQVAFIRQDSSLAVAFLDDAMAKSPIEDNIFARAANMKATIMEHGGHTDMYMYMYYLTLSALSDVLGGTREGTSLQRLGVALHDKGDIGRSYELLAISLDNAVKSGARIRAMESSQAMPIIEKTFREQDERKLMWLYSLVGCLLFAMVGICLFIFYLRREKRKLEILKMNLSRSNQIKETYISQFLNLCSIYKERFDEFNKLVGRKIAGGQTGELYSLVKSGKMLDEQNQLFYEIFDNAFAHIYPTFLVEVNKLLVEDKQIEVSGNVKFNAELRILAFMRLGISDSGQIARFLGLSLNTVYTYRNKIKSRAKNRESFDQDIMSIGEM